MKIETFCKKTGWPLEEFMELYWSEAAEILAFYDLHLTFIIPRRPKKAVK